MYLQKEWQIRFTMLLLKLCLRKNDFLSRIIQNLSGCFLNRKNHSLNEGLFECKPTVPLSSQTFGLWFYENVQHCSELSWINAYSLFKRSNLCPLVLCKCWSLFRVKLKKNSCIPCKRSNLCHLVLCKCSTLFRVKLKKMPTFPLIGHKKPLSSGFMQMFIIVQSKVEKCLQSL